MALSARALASLQQNYNPQGEMGGLFAPAHIAGYAPAQEATMAWQSGRGLSGQQVADTAMPVPWTPPQDTSPWAMGALGAYGGPRSGPGFSMYGPNLADTGPHAFGQKSSVDPAALRAAAQNRPYDWEARRGQVAQQLMANESAKAAWEKSQADQWNYLMGLQGMQQPMQQQGEYLQD